MGLLPRRDQQALEHGDREQAKGQDHHLVEHRQIADAGQLCGEGKLVGDDGENARGSDAAALREALSEKSPRLRFFAAQSLGALRDRPSVDPLIEVIRENADADVFLRHAAVWALHRIGDLDAVWAHRDDAERSVRLAVLLVLPKMVPGPGEQGSAGIPQPNAATVNETPPLQTENSRAEAAQALQDFLQTRARLELANAPVWGEPEWSQAIDLAASGNDLFSQRQFAPANNAFTKALELLLLIESESDQRLTNALNSGWQTLQMDDSTSAIAHFEMALTIDAASENALEGLQRARVRTDLLSLMSDAETALAMGDLPAAQQAYMQAVGLDALYEPAQIALQNVTAKIIDLTFNDAMTRALKAMDAQQVSLAERALQQAESLKPGEEVVRNTQQQLAQLKQKLWLAKQREEAATKEANEDWAAAVVIYQNVTSKVPQAGFARQGLARAEDRDRLHQQLDHCLKDPTRVYSAQPRANAEKLIASAGKPPANEKRLAAKIERLQAMIIEAQTPQMITLQSDGLTNVVIYHVGRLGSFTSQQLELQPGNYTVVGSRPGYRDVRRTFTVNPGVKQAAWVIRCEEPI